MNRQKHRRTLLALAAWSACTALASGCERRAAAAPAAIAPPVVSQVVPQRAPPTMSPTVSQSVARPLPATAPPLAGAAVTDVFAATSWQPPPAPAAPTPAAVTPPAAPPPLPAAPPLPFRFLGRYGDAGVQIVMLVKGEQLYLVSAGDTIDQAYRVDRVSATAVELTYLPLQLKQSLSTGDAG